MTQHTTTMTEAAKIALQIQYEIDDQGGPLTEADKATLQARLTELEANPALDKSLQAEAPAPAAEPEQSDAEKIREAAALFAASPEPEPQVQTPVQTEKDPLGGIDPDALANFINAKVDEQLARKSAGQVAAPAQATAAQGPATIADLRAVLQALDPRDSDAALEALNFLTGTGRLQAIGNLAGGGYLFHYQEPKGSTKEGYTPGGTKGGRMVDQALEAAEAQGLKPVKRGVCPACMNAVIEEEDGTVVLDDETKDATCSSAGRLGTPGAGHVFVG